VFHSFSLLHVVCGLGHVDGARLLLGQEGMDVNDGSNKDGATPLHAAAMSGSLPMVELLLKLGRVLGTGLLGAGGLGLASWVGCQSFPYLPSCSLKAQGGQFVGMFPW
jgi:ankyrin repeat protein